MSENEQSEDTKPLTPMQNTSALVTKYAQKILDDERAQKFAAQVFLLARGDPKFATCTPDSILAAMLACVHLDLMPNTPEQLAFIIPYRNKSLGIMQAQFQVGYKGLVALAYRSAGIASINAELVFPEDTFKVDYGMRTLSHKPDLTIDRTDYSKAIAAYAVAMPANGTQPTFDVMSRSEIDKVRKVVKAESTGTPWKTWEEAMVKKTVVKRLTKLLPQSSKDNRLQYAAAFDSWAEVGKLGVNTEGDLIEQAPATVKVDADKVKKEAEAIHKNFANTKTVEKDDPHVEPEKKPTLAKQVQAAKAEEPKITLGAKEQSEIIEQVDMLGLSTNGRLRYLKDTTGHINPKGMTTDEQWQALQKRTLAILNEEGEQLPMEWYE